MIQHTFQNRKTKNGWIYSQAFGLVDGVGIEFKEPFNKYCPVGQYEKEVKCIVAVENNGKNETVVAGFIPDCVTEISGKTYDFKSILKLYGFKFEKELKTWKRESGKREKVFANIPKGCWAKTVVGIDETKKASYIFEGDFLEKNEYNHLIVGSLVLSKIDGKFSLYRIEAIDENEVSFDSRKLSHQEVILEGSWLDDQQELKEAIKQERRLERMMNKAIEEKNNPLPKTNDEEIEKLRRENEAFRAEGFIGLKIDNMEAEIKKLRRENEALDLELNEKASAIIGAQHVEINKLKAEIEKLSSEVVRVKDSGMPPPIKQVEIKDLRNILENFERKNDLPSNLSKIEFWASDPEELKCQFFQAAEDEVPEEEIFILNFLSNKEGIVNSCNIEIDYSDVFEGFTNKELEYINGMQAAAGLLSLPPIATNLFVATKQDEKIRELRRENEVLKAKLKASEVAPVKSVSTKEIEENGLSVEKINDTILWCLANTKQPSALIIASFILAKYDEESYQTLVGSVAHLSDTHQELIKNILCVELNKAKPEFIEKLIQNFGKSCLIQRNVLETTRIRELEGKIQKLKQPKPKYRRLQKELGMIRKDGNENQKAFLKGLSLRSKYDALLEAWENIPT